jgi:hypothetical protein
MKSLYLFATLTLPLIATFSVQAPRVLAQEAEKLSPEDVLSKRLSSIEKRTLKLIRSTKKPITERIDTLLNQYEIMSEDQSLVAKINALQKHLTDNCQLKIDPSRPLGLMERLDNLEEFSMNHDLKKRTELSFEKRMALMRKDLKHLGVDILLAGHPRDIVDVLEVRLFEIELKREESKKPMPFRAANGEIIFPK